MVAGNNTQLRWVTPEEIIKDSVRLLEKITSKDNENCSSGRNMNFETNKL